MTKLRLGLVVARKERPNLAELDKYLADDRAEIFLFPESYLHSESLERACAIAMKHRKWLITTMDDLRESGSKYETGVVIDPEGAVVGEHKKTSLTRNELDRGTKQGSSIKAIETPFGKIGLSICYEIFFFEVTRIYALQGARVIFNPIGTGMWHEQQFTQWNNVASARAAENGVFVVGCSHHNDAIPMAYAYDPEGQCLVRARDVNRMVRVTLDLDKSYDTIDLRHRRPELYGPIADR